MSSLIIVLISIALVGIMALAGVLFLGSAQLEGSTKVSAAAHVNALEQVKGAIDAYRQDNAGMLPASVSDLVPQYLKSVPDLGDGSTLSFGDGYVQITGVSLDECNEINQRYGFDITPPPSCTDPAYSDVPCCTQ